MCRLRDCSVCECPENEFPEPFKKPFHILPSDDLMCQEGKPEATVDRTLDKRAFRGWIETDNPWTNDDETDNGTATFYFIFRIFLVSSLKIGYVASWSSQLVQVLFHCSR